MNNKIFEGILVDDKENIIEGTMTNIFLQEERYSLRL